MARSASLSVVSWEASLVKTITTVRPGWHSGELTHTEAWGKDGDVEVGSKLLHLCCEHALAGYNIAGQADTNHL